MFWTAFAGINCCPVFDCCVNDTKLLHCGKFPELMCERFTRFKNPEVSDEVQADIIAAMEKELRVRK